MFRHRRRDCPHCKTLNRACRGQHCRITGFYGGTQFRQKMFSLGLRPGKRIEIVQGGLWSPLIIKIDGTQLALGHGMGNKIEIQAC